MNTTTSVAPADLKGLNVKAVDLVRLVLEMTAEAGSGHPTSAASLAHLVTVLLYDHMRWDPAEPDHPAADRLVLSEGHACPIVYAACADLGVTIGVPERRRPMTRRDALRLREIGSVVDGHPNPMRGFPFFPAATGSLGQGLSVAAGMALAARLDGIPKRIFCLIGDGESREGQIWEAIDFLVDHQIHAVCPIFNANGYGQTGPVSSQQAASALARKLEAFGVDPLIVDGHDPKSILDGLRAHAVVSEGAGRPVGLVARTTKGWGTPSLARQSSGKHGKPALGDELERALAELDEERSRCFDGEGADHFHAVRPSSPPQVSVPTTSASGAVAADPEDVAHLGSEKALAPRKAYGMALRNLGRRRADVVVLDGDVSNSTHAETFEEDPGNRARFFESRIAEQNMVSVAVGLASAGKTPFVSTFGKFMTRAYDQVEMGLISGMPLMLVGSHVGISPAADGPSQMALPDAAWFGAWSRVRRDGRPLLHVVTPSDARSAYALTLEMASHDGAVYMRTLRPDVPLLYGENEPFPIGGHKVVCRGDDLLIVAWGYMVHEALRTADRLLEEGVGATVVDLYSLPFATGAVAELARRHRGRVLVVEDNYGGGIGSAVSEALVDSLVDHSVERMFVRRVPHSGRTPDAVLSDLGLSTDHLVETALTLVRAS